MKVLFLSRAKQNNTISPVVQSQARSLSGLLDVSTFQVRGKGWGAYAGNIRKLRKHLRGNKYDIIHAHYAWMGVVAGIASKKPLVVSLMGSDVEDYRIGRALIRMFNWLLWDAVIVKSKRIKERIKLDGAYIIPNGVDLEKFKPGQQEESREHLGLEKGKKYVLFLANPARNEKNHKLAVESCARLTAGCEPLTVYDKPHDKIPLYLSAVDVLLLTSHFEGSPNVIKEAMACNCPIVSTDVGDVREVIGDLEGCYITSFEPEDVAAKLKLALEFGKRTNGREKIMQLDEKIIAEKLVKVYESVLKK